MISGPLLHFLLCLHSSHLISPSTLHCIPLTFSSFFTPPHSPEFPIWFICSYFLLCSLSNGLSTFLFSHMTCIFSSSRRLVFPVPHLHREHCSAGSALFHMSFGYIVCIPSEIICYPSRVLFPSLLFGFSFLCLSSLLFVTLTTSPSFPSSMPHSVIPLWRGMICQQIKSNHYKVSQLTCQMAFHTKWPPKHLTFPLIMSLCRGM